jgi:hypothetical protein
MIHECATIRFTKNELIIMINAINESQEAIEPWEFPIRMGANVDEAEQLRWRLNEVLASIKD